MVKDNNLNESMKDLQARAKNVSPMRTKIEKILGSNYLVVGNRTYWMPVPITNAVAFSAAAAAGYSDGKGVPLGALGELLKYGMTVGTAAGRTIFGYGMISLKTKELQLMEQHNRRYKNFSKEELAERKTNLEARIVKEKHLLPAAITQSVARKAAYSGAGYILGRAIAEYF